MINYRTLFDSFRNEIASDANLKTPDITKKIKEFFAKEFQDYFVAPLGKEKEFLVDIFVSNANPRTLHSNPSKNGLRVILAVESELGGEGGGAQGYLQRNVLEDFSKLLVIRAEYKVLVFTSLPYADEEGHIKNRVDEINSIYKNSGEPGSILLIHLQSDAQKTAKGHPTNPKVSLKQDRMSGYVLSKGLSVLTLT